MFDNINGALPFTDESIMDQQLHNGSMSPIVKQEFISHLPISNNKYEQKHPNFSSNSNISPKNSILPNVKMISRFDKKSTRNNNMLNYKNDMFADGIKGFYDPKSYVSGIYILFMQLKRIIINNPTYLLEMIKMTILLIIVIFQFLIYRSSRLNTNSTKNNIFTQQAQIQSQTPSADIGGI